jgi:hypothetical protein
MQGSNHYASFILYNRVMPHNEISFPLANPPMKPSSGIAEFAEEPAPVEYEVVDSPRSPALQAEYDNYPVDEWSTRGTFEPPEVEDPLVDIDSSYKKARRFHADTPFVLGILLFLIAAMAGASFYVSFSGLFAAAAWAVGDNPPLQLAVPIMLDIAIVAFTLALFVERERGERVWKTWSAIATFAAVSATANILHTLGVSTAVNISELIIGAVISGGAPILLAVGSDTIAVKVFKTADPVTK